MIANIKYGQEIDAIVNYVYKKVEEGQGRFIGSNLLDNPSKQELVFYLKFQGEQKEHKQAFAHISLSLAINDAKVSDSHFKNIANDYMEQMGYAEQPYVVVRHTDTEHEHVHIISTNVREDSTKLYLFKSKERSQYISRSLEKKYGLIQISNDKSVNQELLKPIHSSKFSIENALNSILSQYKPRNFKQLKELLFEQNIELSITKAREKQGILLHMLDANGNRQNIKPIPGSRINRNYSFSKVEKALEKNSKDKLLAAHKKRISKQISTAISLFNTINPNDIERILAPQKINMKTVYGNQKNPIGFQIYDKTGYIFKASEVNRNFTSNKLFSKIDFDSDTASKIDMSSSAFEKSSKKVFEQSYKAYLRKHISDYVYESNLLKDLSLKSIKTALEDSIDYQYLNSFFSKEGGERAVLLSHIQKHLDLKKQQISAIVQKEKDLLNFKIKLSKTIQDVSENPINQYYLLNSLGLQPIIEKRKFRARHILSTTHVSDLTFSISSKESLNTLKSSYNSAYARKINQDTLELLFTDTSKTKIEEFVKKGYNNTLFLKLFYKEIYNNIPLSKKNLFNTIINKTYTTNGLKYAFKKITTPEDFIKHLNYKGIRITKNTDGSLIAHQIYTPESTAILFEKGYTQFLNSSYKLKKLLEYQDKTLAPLHSKPEENGLKTLWLSSIIDQKRYDHAAYLIVKEKVLPFVDPDELSEHMENGLKDAILNIQDEMFNQKLMKLLSTASYLLEGSTIKNEDSDYFKDELSNKKKKKKKQQFKL